MYRFSGASLQRRHTAVLVPIACVSRRRSGHWLHLSHRARPGTVFFPKDGHGWLMQVPEVPLLADTIANAPEDIRDCITLACTRGLRWLMLDADGSALEELQLYDEVSLDPVATQALNCMTMNFVSNVPPHSKPRERSTVN